MHVYKTRAPQFGTESIGRGGIETGGCRGFDEEFGPAEDGGCGGGDGGVVAEHGEGYFLAFDVAAWFEVSVAELVYLRL